MEIPEFENTVLQYNATIERAHKPELKKESTANLKELLELLERHCPEGVPLDGVVMREWDKAHRKVDSIIDGRTVTVRRLLGAVLAFGILVVGVIGLF